jgi:hypothetical protein
MIIRGGDRKLQTENKVTVLWNVLLDADSAFAKDLTEIGEIPTDSSYAHTILCMETR